MLEFHVVFIFCLVVKRRDILLNQLYSFLAAAFFGFGARCDLNKALARRTAAYGKKSRESKTIKILKIIELYLKVD